jgi:hypothetical protein
MRARFSGTMLAIVLSSAISASVAVVVTQMAAPQYANANSTATHRSKGPTLTSVDKTVVADFKATDATLSSIEGQLNALKSSVAAVSTNVAAVSTTAAAANAGLSTITPVVHTIAERLYNTCALTSSMWARSFPDPEGATGTAAWTTSIGYETEGSPLLDVERCYSAGALANESNPDDGGILNAAFDADDSWTAKGP